MNGSGIIGADANWTGQAEKDATLAFEVEYQSKDENAITTTKLFISIELIKNDSAQRVADEVVDQWRSKYSSRPNPPTREDKTIHFPDLVGAALVRTIMTPTDGSGFTTKELDKNDLPTNIGNGLVLELTS